MLPQEHSTVLLHIRLPDAPCINAHTPHAGAEAATRGVARIAQPRYHPGDELTR